MDLTPERCIDMGSISEKCSSRILTMPYFERYTLIQSELGPVIHCGYHRLGKGAHFAHHTTLACKFGRSHRSACRPRTALQAWPHSNHSLQPRLTLLISSRTYCSWAVCCAEDPPLRSPRRRLTTGRDGRMTDSNASDYRARLDGHEHDGRMGNERSVVS
jgi:hypothetical protein